MSALWTLEREYYRGLLMRCAPGVHAAAAGLLRRHGISAGSVLDLASGTGAFLARLRDAGFSDLTAVELVTSDFGVEGVTPLPLNLNEDFAAGLGRRFDLITAIEIVEHLDNPRHFLHECRKLLADDGHILISTPNIATWRGRLKFLRRGEHDYFDAIEYRYNHHVSPITHDHVTFMFREVGFALVDHVTAGGFAGPVKRALTAPFWLPMRMAFGPHVLGDVHIYLARRADPDPWCFGKDMEFLRQPG